MKACLAPALIVLLGFVATPFASAKPAALPSQNQIECPEFSDDPMPGKFSIELDFNAKGITLKFGLDSGNPPQPAPAIDAVNPTLAPMYVRQLFGRFADTLMNWRESVLTPMLDNRLGDGSEEQTDTFRRDALHFQQMREWSVPLGLVELLY
ncbi:MAG: hypothetical protein EXS16_20735 [Gemmataceae bacterium]|nr:hypothetical protein [Gemmataceae bacterium]